MGIAQHDMAQAYSEAVCMQWHTRHSLPVRELRALCKDVGMYRGQLDSGPLGPNTWREAAPPSGTLRADLLRGLDLYGASLFRGDSTQLVPETTTPVVEYRWEALTVTDQIHRLLNSGSPLPPGALVVPAQTAPTDRYLKRLICGLLGGGLLELCHRYLEGAPAGVRVGLIGPVTSTLRSDRQLRDSGMVVIGREELARIEHWEGLILGLCQDQ